MTDITIEQFKAEFDRVIERAGLGERFVILCNGEPVARVTPPRPELEADDE